MISALRKIEGHGELPGATSAVMEMCFDNPREGFGELFDTHPSVDRRVAALVKFAGGHDRGPIALAPQPDDAGDGGGGGDMAPAGPWGPAKSRPETRSLPGTGEDGRAMPPAPPSGEADDSAASGPWGPHRG